MEKSLDQTAVFGGGCFWCTEAVFLSLKGVISVKPGYIGGHGENPTYQQVLSGNTGHVEAIQIKYDSTIISYDDLLVVFFNTHNPTTLNRQGKDIGTQYASVIFYSDVEQKEKAEAIIKKLNDSKVYDAPVVTEVRPLGPFYEAEEYHQNYYNNHKDAPYCEIIIAPKLQGVQEKFAKLLK